MALNSKLKVCKWPLHLDLKLHGISRQKAFPRKQRRSPMRSARALIRNYCLTFRTLEWAEASLRQRSTSGQQFLSRLRFFSAKASITLSSKSMPSRSDCSPSPSLSQVMLHDLDVQTFPAWLSIAGSFHAAADPENHLVSCLVFMVLQHGCQQSRRIALHPPRIAAYIPSCHLGLWAPSCG